MKKKELIKKLEAFACGEKAKWQGQRAFAGFLIEYLKRLSIPYDEKYDFWRIDDYLPKLLVDAFEQLRIGMDEITVRFRDLYQGETGCEVPNITDLGESHIIEQGSAVQTTLGFMIRDITGHEWLATKIDTYCNAQKYVLQQTFDKFARRVYRNGLYDIVMEGGGMSGKFGQTELRTFITGGRVIFTFARPQGKDKQEFSVSFVGEDGDRHLLSAGLQSVYADFKTALDMIEDIITNYPADAEKLKKIFGRKKGVTLDVLAAMEIGEN